MKLEYVQGDISSQEDVEAVVNAANKELQIGGGVAGALHRKAGPELAKAGRPYAPLNPGEAVVTEGFNLPNSYVIHTLGPVYGADEPAEQLLESCYRESLKRAEEYNVASIAFPLISTGAFGYPLEAGIEVALKTVEAHSSPDSSLETVRFVIFSDKEFEVFRKMYENRS